MKKMNSFGNYPASNPSLIVQSSWQDEISTFLKNNKSTFLPIGMRRSYGDSCLHDAGTLLDITGIHKVISFDPEKGILCTEAGIILKDILSFIVPNGWFLPVTPGTQFITIGGAIANDIHGKNHHRVGSFGNHVKRIGLRRSDADEILICSENEYPDLFYATIGGLGLTGIIVWAEFKLVPIKSPMMKTISEQFNGYSEYLDITKREEAEYTVAWFDSVSGGKKFMRGLYNSGDFIDHEEIELSNSVMSVPLYAPHYVLNKWTMKIFNSLYYRKNISSIKERIQHYTPFFYPLDSLQDWNKLYGTRGFLQYQCVVPHEQSLDAIQEIVRYMQSKKMGSFLVVLKSFGRIESKGLLSFPKPGMTLAMDFPMRGAETLKLLSSFDEIVHQAGGRVYPAKDARMSGEHFRAWYPGYERMLQLKDPAIESDFWKRVMI